MFLNSLFHVHNKIWSNTSFLQKKSFQQSNILVYFSFPLALFNFQTLRYQNKLNVLLKTSFYFVTIYMDLNMDVCLVLRNHLSVTHRHNVLGMLFLHYQYFGFFQCMFRSENVVFLAQIKISIQNTPKTFKYQF